MSITRFSKKFTALAVMPFAAALTLSACGAKTAETTYTLEEDGVEATTTLTHKGDEIIKETSTNVIDYDAFGVADKEEAEMLMKMLFGEDLEADVEGFEFSIEYGETSATQKVLIDYDIADPSELDELTVFDDGEDLEDGGYVSLKETSELLESDGYSEVK